MQKLNLKEERYPTGNSIDAIRYIKQMAEPKPQYWWLIEKYR
jgi:hypothetical protein